MDRAYHEALMGYLQLHSLERELNYYLMHAFTEWGTQDYSRLFWEALYLVEQRAHELQLPPPVIPLETQLVPTEADCETQSVISDDLNRMSTDSRYTLLYARKWLDTLLGKSTGKRKYTSDQVALVKGQILAHGIRCRSFLTVDIVRMALKSLKLSKLFSQANYILMDLLKEPPVTLTDDELMLIQDGLQKIAFHYPSVSEHFGKTNMPYMPYLLYKLFEQFTPSKAQALRRFIHFQSPAAVQKNDQVWQMLCTRLEIPFQMTEGCAHLPSSPLKIFSLIYKMEVHEPVRFTYHRNMTQGRPEPYVRHGGRTIPYDQFLAAEKRNPNGSWKNHLALGLGVAAITYFAGQRDATLAASVGAGYLGLQFLMDR